MLLSTICLLSWATSAVLMNGKGWVMAEKARVNKRQLDNSLGPMLLRLSKNKNNEDRNRIKNVKTNSVYVQQVLYFL